LLERVDEGIARAMTSFSAEELRKFAIFHPLAFEKYQAMHKPLARFAHYCSAEAAFHILKSRKMRLRNAAVMNDFMEIEHGSACLARVWRSDTGKRLKEIVDGLFPGLSDELTNVLDAWRHDFQTETFITCLSEHDPEENELGKLSMWRAYGGSSGVAIVLNPAVFLSVSDALPTFTSPVAYLSPEAFEMEFERVVGNIETSLDFIKAEGRDELYNSLFHAFRTSMLCTKHPGFSEEREWRIVYAPSLNSSDRIIPSVELIRGAPQIVHSIPFKDYPEEGLVGAELPKLIDRVIIGPTEFPYQLRQAIVSLLTEAGVTDAAEKVFVSTIPLRQ
jgi:hypothetical protein